MKTPEYDPQLILVVDDVHENRELAKIYLEKLGWRTLACESAESALRLLSGVTPGHILLDIKMPGMGGIAFARVIRSTLDSASTKIVGYTAHALSDEIKTIMDAGFDALLIKPVTYRDISDCFGNHGLEFL